MFEIQGLQIRPQSAQNNIVSIDTLRFEKGRTHIILGRSGAGKSLLARALSGMSMPGFHIDGSCKIDCTHSLSLGHNRSELSANVFLLPQEPGLMLDPTMRVGRQVGDVLHWRKSPASSFDEIDTLARSVGLLPKDMRKFPHECSGGMLQRMLITMALVARAGLIICDEPTKGLDDTSYEDVVRQLEHVQDNRLRIVIITHDLRLARRFGDDLTVIDKGRVVESGPALDVLTRPQSPALITIMNAEPARWPMQSQPPTNRKTALVGLQRIGHRAPHKKSLNWRQGKNDSWLFQGINLTIHEGEVVGLFGPSGVGKTTLCDIALGIRKPTAGTVTWLGQSIDELGWRARKALRPDFIKLFQDPGASLPSDLRADIILRQLTPQKNESCHSEGGLLQMLERLHLEPSILTRTPSTMSGGELQRLAIARALLAKPRFIVCDEPSSRLDMVVQKDALGLLISEARRIGAAMLFVSHDRRILDRVADRIFELRSGCCLKELPCVGIAHKEPEAIRM